MTLKRHPNRLIHETSPYLRQHAYNPVDWYPWGEEAFDAARRENKPLLLSIGYSTCHWCHVMERESFENEEIAEIMNRHFVSIKVDREERPDLDQIYQSVVPLFTRRGGGWPLTLFLTPDQMPFYGGTYFPPRERHGLPGFSEILQEIASVYREKSQEISQTTLNIQRALQHISQDHLVREKQEELSDILPLAVDGLSLLFDSASGGFGGAPKFPAVPALSLFLRHADQSGDATSLNRVCYTLGKMAWGGIYDQLGGGFHRYATDAAWKIPHFEKMLYDNAQLARLYFWTYQATGQAFYAQIGREILEYVLREMTDPSGGFYTAQDADSEGEEGLFFVWTPQEIRSLFSSKEGELLCRYFDVTPSGNFEGRNILWIPRPLFAVAREMGLSLEEGEAIVQEGKKRLLLKREERVKPFRDEKIITSLNGLMIGALVEGYQVTRETRYLQAAERAAQFIRTYSYKEDGTLLHNFKDNHAKGKGYLDDYAYFINALMDLYEATMEKDYLNQAQTLSGRLMDQFWDMKDGGFFFSGRDHEALIVRLKPYTDPSIPSGNAVAASALLRLFYLTHDQAYFDLAERTLQVFSGAMRENVFATSSLIAAADLYGRGPKEITLFGALHETKTQNLLSRLYTLYLPNKIVRVGASEGAEDLAIRNSKETMPTVVICQQGVCSLPLRSWEEIQEALLKNG